MNKSILFTAIVGIVIIVVVVFMFTGDRGPEDPTDTNGVIEYNDLIRITNPATNAVVSSPLTITGEARGMWYFEASFPISILDANGTLLGQHYATAMGDWMTEEYVPFESRLVFDFPETETGTLILHKDNPSGLEEHEDEVQIPVRFNSGVGQTIQLYYYDPILDEDEDGNILCSEAGLVALERTIPITQTPIQDSIKLLLQGGLTQEEIAQGITTEYPLEGLELEGASLADGILTLAFADPNGVTGGGSCRANILWLQIQETAKQFDGVEEVQFQPEELFQP